MSLDPDRRARIETEIRAFHERVRAARDVLRKLDDVLDIAPESPLYEAVWALIGGYMGALGAAYGHIDGWLEWWWSECDLGANPHDAGLPGEPMRTIETLDDLVGIVLDDLARTEEPV